jgi:uncharacterized protein (UPF0248 family)
METIQQLLSRIRWDEAFGCGDFEIGIYDRISNNVEFLALDRIKLEKGNHFTFTTLIDGKFLTIPFHRIREVRKDGECIWKRRGFTPGKGS